MKMDVDGWLNRASLIPNAQGSHSAAQRVALTPELATLIFLHLDKPANFSAACHLFHGIATTAATVYTWFNRRYWKCEIFYALLLWRGLSKPMYIDVCLQ